MLQLLMLLLVAGPGPGPDIGSRMNMNDRVQGPSPVNDKFLLPPKLNDCRTDTEVRAALDARRYGDREPCDPDPLLRRAR